MSHPVIRPAGPDELDLAVSIDDDACELYPEFGLDSDMPDDHPFYAAEHARWRRAHAKGGVFFACAPGGEPVGLAVLDEVDENPYLEQLSVRHAWMRRGIGTALVRFAQRWAAHAGALYLSTWEHLPFNGPFYERLSFRKLPEAEAGPSLRAILRDERAALPAPEHRILMVHRAPPRS